MYSITEFICGRNFVLFVYFIAVIVIVSASCKRAKQSTPAETGGKGGRTTLKIITKHHVRIIDSAKIFIKYNEQDASTSYDDSVSVSLVDSTGTFSGLKKGKYYLFGRGWDRSINNYVQGGLPISVDEEKKYDISLPVTEGD